MADVSDTAIYVAAAAFIVPKAVDLLIGVFKGSVSRNIDAADKAQSKLEDKVERLDRELLQLRSAHESHKEADDTALGTIEGRLVALDNRIAGQGKAYEEKIETGFKKLEIELNRRLAQVVSELDASRRRRSR